jgi:hypothetical protein
VGTATFRTIEDDIFHGAPSQILGALFTHAPAKRVYDVRLAATIGTNNADDVVIKMDDGSVYKRLEPADIERLNVHRIVLIDPLSRPVGQLIQTGCTPSGVWHLTVVTTSRVWSCPVLQLYS